jgi:hypothetical protein
MPSMTCADREGSSFTSAAATIAALIPAVPDLLAFPDLDNPANAIAADVAKIVGRPTTVCIAAATDITRVIIGPAFRPVPRPRFADRTGEVSVLGRRFGRPALRRGILSAVTIVVGAAMLVANAFAAANAFKWPNFLAGYARYTRACFGFAALRFLKPEFYPKFGCPL